MRSAEMLLIRAESYYHKGSENIASGGYQYLERKPHIELRTVDTIFSARTDTQKRLHYSGRNRSTAHQTDGIDTDRASQRANYLPRKRPLL